MKNKSHRSESHRSERVILSWILAISLVLNGSIAALGGTITTRVVYPDDTFPNTAEDVFYGISYAPPSENAFGGALYIKSGSDIASILVSFEGNHVTSCEAYTGAGGAIFILPGACIGEIKDSSFIDNFCEHDSASANNGGGAIYTRISSDKGTTFSFIGSIIGSNFVGNYVKGLNRAASAGAIYNGGYAIIGCITGSNFIGNYAEYTQKYSTYNPQASAGAIGNNGKIGSITGATFIENFAKAISKNDRTSIASAGAISNSVEIGSIADTTFEGNSAEAVSTLSIAVSEGGAIGNNGKIGSIADTTFEGNHAIAVTGASDKVSEAKGGAIHNEDGTITTINDSTFAGNYVSAGSYANGGAIYNKTTEVAKSIGSITGTSFADNYAETTGASGKANGGAIYNYKDSQIGGIADSSFEGNYVKAIGTNGIAQGGAIYNEGWKKKDTPPEGPVYEDFVVTDSSFTDNFAVASGASGTAQGGAIYTTNLLINAQDKDVVFRGNYVKAENMTKAKGSAIYLEYHTEVMPIPPYSKTVPSTLTLQANAGRKIIFEDDQTIEGSTEYKFNVNIKGGGTVEFLQENATKFKESGIYDAKEVTVGDGGASGTPTLIISNLASDKLTFNDGIIDFTRDATAKPYEFSEIEIKAGGGQLKLDADLSKGEMDSFNATNSGTFTPGGELHITTLALLKDSAQDETPITFTSNTNLASATHYTGAEELASHANKYKVRYDNTTGNFIFTKSGVSDTTTAVGDGVNVTNFVWLETVNNLQKRLGDLRGGEESDMAWARFQRNNDDHKGSREFNVSGNLYQVGYDFALKNQVASRGYFGVSLDAFDGTQSYKIGGGDVKSMSLGAYYTKIYDSGHYFDFILRYGRLENDSTSYDATAGISGILTKLDYAMNSVTLSGEYGYRWNMGKSGLYLEPQAEFIYGYLSGAQATSSTNYLADIDSTNHFVTRLGLAFGQRVKNFNYYLRGSYYHDFAGTIHVKYGGTPYQQDSAQNWWEVSLGGGWNISKLSYFYAELTKHFKDVSNSLNFNLGFRFTL